MIALIRKINESIRVNNNVDEIYVMATFLNTNAHHAYAVSHTKDMYARTKRLQGQIHPKSTSHTLP